MTVKHDERFYQNQLLPACNTFFHKNFVPAIQITPDNTTAKSESKEELTAVLTECGTDIPVSDPSLVIGRSQFRQHVKLVLQGPFKDKTEDVQITYFLLWIGEKGQDMFNTFNLAADQRKSVKETFDAFQQ